MKLPPNWCKVAFNFCSVCYNLSEIFSFLSLNMDFVKANSADSDEMTHHVAFHLGLPCSMKYPILVYKGYTKAYHLLYLGTQSCHVLHRIKFVIAFIVFLSKDERFLRRRQQFPYTYLPKVTSPGCHVFERPSLFICFVVGHRGNFTAKFYSILILTISSRGYVKSFL